VLFDDRKGVRAGEKFADSDLLGVPCRIVVSPRTAKNKAVEIKRRNSQEAQVMALTEFLAQV
jgi:prolyl-tRNA synthetase